ncbi:MAG TPA: SDR family oxidoreductase [Prolixibacteraceae bacterium]|nr:SDR family oxidoreductase [Prolixibacteraceae bacterium]
MKQKVVIVTGASSGIGRALVYRFAAEGSKVVMAARTPEILDELVRELGADKVLSVPTDVTDETQCRLLIEKSVEAFGRIDVLVNNAGISMRAAFASCDTAVLKRLMEVNFWGTVYCTQYALPYILNSRGSVVGVISIAGYIGLPGRTGYSASKFAVRGFLDALRTEHLAQKLHVLVAAPGFVASRVRENALTASGRPQGETPRDEKRMMSAERCAFLIYRALRKQKSELIMSFTEGKLAVFLSKFLPRWVAKLNYRMMVREPGCPFAPGSSEYFK